MLGIIEENKKRSRLSICKCGGKPLAQLELKNTSHAGRMIKRMRKGGVTTIAVCPRLYNDLKPQLDKFRFKISDGKDMMLRMSSRFAFEAVRDEGISLSDIAVEIHSGRQFAFHAVGFWSKYVRYVFVTGHCARLICDMSSEKLGVSVVMGTVPDRLFKGVLRLYFDGRDEVFSLETFEDIKAFSNGSITLPCEFDVNCKSESKLPLAQALVDLGAIDVEDINVSDVVLE